MGGWNGLRLKGTTIPRHGAAGLLVSSHGETIISKHPKATLATRIASFTKLIAAITQYITAAIVLGGKSITPQALAAVYQAYLKAQADLDAARGVVTEKQQIRDAALRQALATTPGLRKYLAATYGEDSPTYGAFGLPVTKKAVRPVKTKAAAADKATTTRARHKAALEAVSAAAPTPAPAPGATPVAKA
jgi:hypothetical protein